MLKLVCHGSLCRRPSSRPCRNATPVNKISIFLYRMSASFNVHVAVEQCFLSPNCASDNRQWERKWHICLHDSPCNRAYDSQYRYRSIMWRNITVTILENRGDKCGFPSLWYYFGVCTEIRYVGYNIWGQFWKIWPGFRPRLWLSSQRCYWTIPELFLAVVGWSLRMGALGIWS